MWSPLRGSLCSGTHCWGGETLSDVHHGLRLFAQSCFLRLYLSETSLLPPHLKPLVLLTPFQCLLPDDLNDTRSDNLPWSLIITMVLDVLSASELFWVLQSSQISTVFLVRLCTQLSRIVLLKMWSLDWRPSPNYLLLPVHNEMNVEIENNHLKTFMTIWHHSNN